MKQEEKDLLIKDLCARLPYSVKIQTPSNCWTSDEDICELKEIFKGDDGLFRIGDIGALIEYSKPYLFPLSSMTEEQLYNNPIGFSQMLTIKANRDWENITINRGSYYKLVD